MGESTEKSARDKRVDKALAATRDLPQPVTPPALRKHFESYGFELWTMNEVVAANIRRARQEKGWSQFELAERMQRWSSKPWSNASVSAAERSRESGRTRRFGADELMALAWVFRQPLTYFFLPPTSNPHLEPLFHLGDYDSGTEGLGGLITVEAVLDFIDPVKVTKPFVDRMRAAFGAWTDEQWEPPKRPQKKGQAVAPQLPESWINLAHTLRLAAQMIEDATPSRARMPERTAAMAATTEPPQFVKGIRGYDKDQVDHYVSRAEQEIATLLGEREQAYSQIRHLAEQLAQLQHELRDARQPSDQ